jgi:phage tail sheath protein FI
VRRLKMPEYLSPGVYVEEFEIGAKPIEGVGTSTAAFLGVAEKGPLNKPTLVTTQEQFIKNFGGYLKGSYLAYAVDGFFRNGGKRCFIVRIANGATKGKTLINNRVGGSLMTVNALNEGYWGNDISLKVVDASSGSTVLFLSDLADDATSGASSIKLSSTAGLSIGSRIIITDGTNSQPLTVEGFSQNNMVNFSPQLLEDYNSAVTSIYAQIPSESVSTTVKSAAGFSRGVIAAFQPADPTLNPTCVTLSAVRQPARTLEWQTGLKSAINGAVCVDINGVKTVLSLRAGGSPIAKGNDSILKDDLFPVDSVNLLKQGDKVDFTSGLKKETLTIESTVGNDIKFKGKFNYGYTADNSTKIVAHTSSKTKLFADTYSGFKKNIDGTASIILDTGVKGLKNGDNLQLIKKGASDIEGALIHEVNNDINIKLETAPGKDFQVDGTGVQFILKKGDKAIVVASPEGFTIGNLIDIDAGGNKKRFRISDVQGNRLILEGVSDFSADVAVADVIAKEWIATSVSSREFQIIAVYGDNEVEEKFDKLSIDESSDRYFAREGVINKLSTLIEVIDERDSQGAPPESIDDLPEQIIPPRTLLEGSDGSKPEAGNYIGTIENETRKGLVALETVDEVNILAIPDLMYTFGGGNGNESRDDVEQVQLAMIRHCENLKDRFAILDPIKGHTVQNVLEWRMDNLDSKYAALYYPWIKVSDPIGAENSTSRFVPPSAHIAGIYARSDTERGVHKAPANEVVSGVIELEKTVTTGEQDILNPKGINCIRAFPGRGIRVWGARTISSDSLWKYINVRRLFIYIEESIEESTQWVVFEPNDEKLWGRVKATITEFLTRVWKDGALMGTKAEEAFFVKCDRTTMTQSDIDNGKLIVVIGISPVKPAEFVIFRIAQWTGGSSVSE